MTRTDELVQQLRDYARYRYTRPCQDINDLTDAQLREAVEGAQTYDQAWRRVRAYVKMGGTTAPVPVPAKMSTAEYQSRCRPLMDVNGHDGKKPMCWEAVLDAFGVFARSGKAEPTCVINGHMKAAGYGLEQVASLAPPGVTPTLAVFLAAHRKGDYVVYMNGHVVCIRDGVITDTIGRTSTVKKKVTSAYRVTAPELPVSCTCLDPAVFGHAHDCPLSFRRQRDLGQAAAS